MGFWRRRLIVLFQFAFFQGCLRSSKILSLPSSKGLWPCLLRFLKGPDVAQQGKGGDGQVDARDSELIEYDIYSQCHFSLMSISPKVILP